MAKLYGLEPCFRLLVYPIFSFNIQGKHLVPFSCTSFTFPYSYSFLFIQSLIFSPFHQSSFFFLCHPCFAPPVIPVLFLPLLSLPSLPIPSILSLTTFPSRSIFPAYLSQSPSFPFPRVLDPAISSPARPPARPRRDNWLWSTRERIKGREVVIWVLWLVVWSGLVWLVFLMVVRDFVGCGLWWWVKVVIEKGCRSVEMWGRLF